MVIFTLIQLPAREEKANLTPSDVCGCYGVGRIDNCVVVPNDASLKIKGYSCHLESSFQIKACFVFLSSAEAQMSGWCLPLHQHCWIAQSEGETQKVLSMSSGVNHSLLKGALEKPQNKADCLLIATKNTLWQDERWLEWLQGNQGWFCCLIDPHSASSITDALGCRGLLPRDPSARGN